MTRKYILLFIVFTIIIFTLLESLLGTKGYLVNRSYRLAIAELEYRHAALSLEVESLGKRLDNAWEEDELRDTALRLGYSVPGDSVYFLKTSEALNRPIDGTPVPSVPDMQKEIPGGFKGLRSSLLLVFSFGLSGVLSCALGITNRRKRKGSLGNERNHPAE